MNTQISEDIIEKIIYNYCIKQWGQAKSGREFGVSPSDVRKILVSRDIHIRTKHESIVLRNENIRTFNINENYFSVENPNMAYLLGFIAADGTLRKKGNGVKITLAAVDGDFLETIRTELGYDGNVRYYEDSKGYQNATLEFASRKIREDLSYYGLVPNKTFKLEFPTILNKIYWIDFIRGYFDGDGSVGTAGQGLRWQICGAQRDFLQNIVDFLYDEYKIPKVEVRTQQRVHPIYYFQYSTNSTRAIFNILYTPNSLYLPRKYNKFKSIVI